MVDESFRSCRPSPSGVESPAIAGASPRSLHWLPPALAIAGMHRSGTSYVASLFDGAGIKLGERQLGVGHGNARGHFEDLDFLELHQRALRSCGFHGDGIVPAGRITFPMGLEARAGEIVAARRAAGLPWGWKDPRTLLFLDFWADQVPEATWLMVFRSPWEVADSLYRRLDEACITDPLLALRAWEHANRILLDFARRRPERCLVRELGQVIADPAGTFAVLRERFGLPLADPPPRFEAELLGGDAAARGAQASIVRALLPEVDALYGELRDVAESRVPLPTPWRATAEPVAAVAAVATWARASRERTIAATAHEQAVGAARTAAECLLAEEQARSAESERLLAEERARTADSERQLAGERARSADSERQLAEERARSADSERQLAEERARSADSERQLAEERARSAESERQLAEERARIADSQRQLAEERARSAESERQLAEERARSAESERQLAEEQALAATVIFAVRAEGQSLLTAEHDAGERRLVAEREAWELELAAARAETAAVQSGLDVNLRLFGERDAEQVATIGRHLAEIESLVAEINRLKQSIEDSAAEPLMPLPKPRTLAKLRREASRVVRQLRDTAGVPPLQKRPTRGSP